jgi:hypothetical protein
MISPKSDIIPDNAGDVLPNRWRIDPAPKNQKPFMTGETETTPPQWADSHNRKENMKSDPQKTKETLIQQGLTMIPLDPPAPLPYATELTPRFERRPIDVKYRLSIFTIAALCAMPAAINAETQSAAEKVGPPTEHELRLHDLIDALGDIARMDRYEFREWLTGADSWYGRVRENYLALQAELARKQRDQRLVGDEVNKINAEKKAAEDKLAKLRKELKKAEASAQQVSTKHQQVVAKQSRIQEDLADLSAKAKFIESPMGWITELTKRQSHADIDDVTAWIDREMEAHWRARDVAPAGPAGDATYLRRVYLDVLGTVPAPEEVDAFLADASPDKRAELVDRLVEDPRYADHFANLWDVMLLGRGYLPDDKTRHGMVRWLKREFGKNTPYDEFITAMLTVNLQHSGETSPAMFLGRQQADSNRTAATVMTRFLGIQVQCAQCHDHKTEKWTQDDFHSIAAFFVRQRERRVVAQEYEIYDQPNGEKKYKNPAGEEFTVGMRYYDGTTFNDWLKGPDGKPVLGENGQPVAKPISRREQFAEKMVSDPQFAVMAVNRAWSLMFGRGLVHPVEEIRPGNPASIPGILEGVAEQFRLAKFDQRWLIRVLARTKAYQLSSTPPSSADVDPAQFAVYRVKAISGEQVIDSVLTATNYRGLLLEKFKDDKEKDKKVNGHLAKVREDFLKVFAWEEEKVVDPLEGTLPQALVLANGPATNEGTRPLPGGTVAGVLSLPPDQQIDRLYRASLSRDAKPEEKQRAIAFLDQRKDKGQAAGDLFWSLLNAAEFRYNH